jgi:hypothetical protein
MHSDALKELLDIINLEGDGFRKGPRLRREALAQWLEDWVLKLEAKQLVLNSSVFPADYQDELRERLALSMLTDASQECIYNQHPTHITSELHVIRRKKNLDK